MNALRTPIAATRRVLVTSLLVLPCLVAAVVAGCGDDDTTSPVSPGVDSGADGSRDANTADTFVPNDTGAPADAGSDADATTDAGPDAAAAVARGKYMVEAVIGCGDCHTPRKPDGSPDLTKLLSGVDCFIDVDGPTDGGCLSSSNLTNHATGLANRSDAEIKAMFMDGKRPNGQNLSNVMPYYVLHNLKAEDADAIVAYLRTVPGIEHTSRPNDPPFTNPGLSDYIDPAIVPVAGDAGLEAGADLDNGRYLASISCMECHTKHTQGPGPALNLAKLFAGDEAFPAAALGLPSPPFPETIISANITPHDPTGLHGWTVADIKKAMQHGTDRQDAGICPPMPAGPNGFGKMVDKDLTDIASYVHGLPATENALDGGSGSCVLPTGP